MAEEFTNGAEIDAVHDQSTGKSVPVAMPGIIRKLCCIENMIEPISLASQLPSGGVEEEVRVSYRVKGAMRLQCSRQDNLQRARPKDDVA